MIGRIVRPADFQRVLAAPLRSRSAHFAVHFLADRPGLAKAAADRVAPSPPHVSAEVSAKSGFSTGLPTELSTTSVVVEPAAAVCVDEFGLWLGLVVPKRHAKRAVTRNLLKRQIRCAMQQFAPELPGGLWVVRLRTPFDRQVFLSPGSDVLRHSAHEELALLFDRAIRSPLPPRAPRSAGSGSAGRARA